MKTEVVVIGGGPGGYAAAIRLGQLGKEVVLVEKHRVGGTCLQMGCIPSKSLIAAAKKWEDFQNISKMGFHLDGSVRVNFPETQNWKNRIVEQLTKGVEHLCKSNKVKIVHGEAHFSSPHQVVVKTSDKEEMVDFEACILATGSVPSAVPHFEFDGKRIISSTEALNFQEIPRQMAVIGGGYIGLELGSLYAKMGTKVSVIEMTPGLLPGFDRDAVAVIERKLGRNKVDIFLETKALKYVSSHDRITLELNHKGEIISLDVDCVLVTVGRKPFTEGLSMEKAGVSKNDQGFIPVNASRQSNVSHIYAIGDVAGGPLLAHKATREAEVAAEHVAGKKSVYDPRVVPGVVFTDPELASVGLSEEEARKEEGEIIVGKFPFAASAKAMISGATEGFVKVIAKQESHDLLGVVIVGSEAGTMISEAAALIEMGATLEDLALTIHPHPTAPEALMEAAKAALGEAIHIVNTV